MRTEGMFTYETEFGETLQIDRDFLLNKLICDNNKKYQELLKEICRKRLLCNDFFNNKKILDIEKILGKKENIVKEACSVIKKSKLNDTKHFERLKDKTNYQEILKELRYSDDPLLEMLNVLWVERKIPIDEIKKNMDEFISGKISKNSKYKRDYTDKYNYQLAFTLLHIYNNNKKLKKLYYSFNTFTFLSNGSVNDFISLCRNTFYQLDSTYFSKIDDDPLIPFELQTNGASKTAYDQLDKIKSNNENGLQMHTFVMNIGNLFSLFHKEYGEKYPETNQFAFIDEAEIENHPNLAKCLRSLLKWGAIIKKAKPQSISIGKRKGSVYYLNHIFAPIFNISYRIRGGHNPTISTRLFEKMISNSLENDYLKHNLIPKTNNDITEEDMKIEELPLFCFGGNNE
jgi:hypothetical protein